MIKKLIGILFSIGIINQVQAGNYKCSLSGLQEAKSPYKNPKYGVHQGGNQLLDVGNTITTANHIIPKGGKGTNLYNLKEIFAKVNNADANEKKLFVKALGYQVLASLGNPTVEELQKGMFKLTYSASNLFSTADITQVNKLLGFYGEPLIHFNGTVRAANKAEALALLLSPNNKDNTPGSGDTIEITSVDSEFKACDTLRTSSSLFIWNPANLFYSPQSNSRSWDPIQDTNDKTDSWGSKITTDQDKSSAALRWVTLGKLKDANTSANTITIQLANAIAGDGYGNISKDNAKNNILLWNGKLNQDSLGIPFVASDWKYYYVDKDRIWCHTLINKQGGCTNR